MCPRVEKRQGTDPLATSLSPPLPLCISALVFTHSLHLVLGISVSRDQIVIPVISLESERERDTTAAAVAFDIFFSPLRSCCYLADVSVALLRRSDERCLLSFFLLFLPPRAG